MDPELTRQIIPALHALGGVLFGAILAATIQWRNTHATILSSYEQAERARDHEHATWLRNHKAEVYANFVDLVTALLAQCKWMERGKTREDKIAEMVFDVRPTMIRLVAPDEICAQCMWATGAVFPREENEYRDKRVASIHDDLAKFSAL